MLDEKAMLNFLKSNDRRALLSVTTHNDLIQAVVFTTGNANEVRDRKGKVIDILDILSEHDDAVITIEPIN